jgi:hypothetical protein
MTTYRPTTAPSKPTGADRIPIGTLGYFRARNKHRVYDLVVKEFKKAGISQADLARRLGLGTDRVCRMLGAPGNWTLDTASDLLFAISGAEPTYGLAYPLERPKSNWRAPDWLYEEKTDVSDTSSTADEEPLPESAPARAA